MTEIKWIPLRPIKNPLISLEERLMRMKGTERQRELHGVYKQLAISQKGGKTKGPYRDFVDAEPRRAVDLAYGVVQLLEKYGMPYHAVRLWKQYMVLSDVEGRIDAPDF